MSVFDQTNTDADTIYPAQAATGPRVGFQESFSNAFQQQARGVNMMGLQESFRQEEADQIGRMKKAGVESIPSINPEATFFLTNNSAFDPNSPTFSNQKYLDSARFFVHGGDQATADHLAEYDQRIADLQKRFPDAGFKSSRDMWNTVVSKAQAAEDTYNNERTSIGGKFGTFTGALAGQMDVRSNPLGPLAFMVGGVGETALARIATEGLGQGAVQALSEVTGTAENRKLLGLENGVEGSIERVAGAAVGGAVLRGVGEGLHFAGKRWFGSTDLDPAPPPPPEEPPPGGPLLLTDQRPKPGPPGVTPEQEATVRDLMSGTKTYNDVLYPDGDTTPERMGKARSILDTDYVAAQLEPFDGKQPWEIPPPTATAIPKRVNDFVSPDIPVDIHDPTGNVDALARQVDPKAFALYDQLSKENDTYRTWLYQMKDTGVGKLDAAVQDVADKIDNLKQSIDTGRVNGRTINKVKKAELQNTLQDLETQRETAQAKLREGYTPEMRQIADKQYQNGLKMRDLSPVISRAYAYAKNQWELDGGNRELFRKMVREGSRTFPTEPPPLLNDTYENTLQRFSPSIVDKAPILEQSDKVAGRMGENADAADYAMAILKENQKTLDDAIDQYRSGLTKILSGEEGTLKINGQDYNLHLDQDYVHVPNEDGEGSRKISIRQLLEENAQSEEELKAVQSCSIV